LLAVVDSELDFILFFGTGWKDEGGEKLWIPLVARYLRPAEFHRFSLDEFEEYDHSVHFIEGLGWRQGCERECELKVGNMLLMLDGESNIGRFNYVHINLFFIISHLLPLT
jgi:hypothetical protein